MKNLLIVGALLLGGAWSVWGHEFRVERNIPYYSEARLAEAGDAARKKCKLDVRWPMGVTNFATVVNFHGGGLVSGARHFAPWPVEATDKDPVAGVAVGYRFLTETTPEECVGDAAAAVAWTLENISRYGGDPKKVFVTGISGGGYLTAMIGMDPRWLGAWDHKTTDLAGIVPLTGQVTKHFNVRAVSFKDAEPRYAPKVDPWAPLYWVKEARFPPSLFLTGGRADDEMPCRVEENELLGISMRRCGHKNCSFIETEGSHGGGVEPSSRHLRDFVMKWCDAGGVGRLAAGERVVFVGDAACVAQLQLFQCLRNPGARTRVMGGGGDVLALRPDRVFVTGGREIADTFAAAGVKTVLVTPSPGDPDAAARAEAVRALARARNWGLIEMFDPLTAIFKGSRPAHPGAVERLLMAAQVLDQMRVTPIVAQVSLDAANGKVYPRANGKRMPETRNAVVSAVRRLPRGGLAFTYAPKALPFPTTAEYAAAEALYPLTARLNQERFVVTNLAAGAYGLAFDGTRVGTFAADEFRAGVNVAPLATPNQTRARAAAALAEELRRIVERCGKGAREPELIAEEEDIRERLNAVRPAVSRVTITPADLTES
ncbi:MAG: alpha/beta hydrolase [Kiritimatiellia bacterium]